MITLDEFKKILGPKTDARKASLISIEKLKKIDPVNTLNLSDEEIEELRASFYDMAGLIFEDWVESKISGSNYPTGVFQINENDNKI